MMHALYALSKFLIIVQNILRTFGKKNSEKDVNHTLRNDDDFNLPNPRIEFFKKRQVYSLPH